MNTSIVEVKHVKAVLAGGIAIGIGIYIDRRRNKKMVGDFVILDTEPVLDSEPDILEEETHEMVDNDVEEVYEDIPIDEITSASVVNVFTNSDDAWDEEYEATQRIDGEPYIIRVDTFMENEFSWTKDTLTYYQGDDILADNMNTPVYGHKQLVGPLRFGHGSGDKNVGFVRNPALHREWEILLDTGKFETEVLGYDMVEEIEKDEIKHSMTRKFRDD